MRHLIWEVQIQTRQGPSYLTSTRHHQDWVPHKVDLDVPVQYCIVIRVHDWIKYKYLVQYVPVQYSAVQLLACTIELNK